MLSEIRAYLSERHRASLAEIALRLKVSPEAARGMLDHWMRKGRVCRLAAFCNGGCSRGCGSCAESAANEIYEWVA
jgi:predicted ArsR family transcriptional regulator